MFHKEIAKLENDSSETGDCEVGDEACLAKSTAGLKKPGDETAVQTHAKLRMKDDKKPEEKAAPQEQKKPEEKPAQKEEKKPEEKPAPKEEKKPEQQPAAPQKE